jgi:hypothetical protein
MLTDTLPLPVPDVACYLSAGVLTEAPNGTLLIEVREDVAVIYSDQMPDPEDWQLMVALLRWWGADPYALSAGPTAEGDTDVWTAQIDPHRTHHLL